MDKIATTKRAFRHKAWAEMYAEYQESRKTVSVVVLSSVDVINIFRGRISAARAIYKELLKVLEEKNDGILTSSCK